MISSVEWGLEELSHGKPYIKNSLYVAQWRYLMRDFLITLVLIHSLCAVLCTKTSLEVFPALIKYDAFQKI